MSGSGISWAVCKSVSRSSQITMPAPHHSFFLQAGCPSTNQQRQSTEGTGRHGHDKKCESSCSPVSSYKLISVSSIKHGDDTFESNGLRFDLNLVLRKRLCLYITNALCRAVLRQRAVSVLINSGSKQLVLYFFVSSILL